MDTDEEVDVVTQRGQTVEEAHHGSAVAEQQQHQSSISECGCCIMLRGVGAAGPGY